MTRSYRYLLGILVLLTVMVSCRGGCSSEVKEGSRQFEESEPLALLVKNRFDSTSITINKHAARTLDYAQIPYETFDFTLGNSGLEIPESVRLLYLTTDRVEQMNDREVEKLLNFVSRGNQLVILTPLYDKRFHFFQGIIPSDNLKRNNKAEGFSFKQHIFPNYKGEQYHDRVKYIHNGFKGGQFVDNKNIIATAANNPEYPVIIQRDIGQGRAIYFNTTVISDKNYRGLLFSVGLKALEGLPYRVANVSTIFLDDFPAPLYDEKLKPIDQEYDTTHANFVTHIWWPEMKALADSFDMDYTAVMAFNYNAVVVPPFDFKEWTSSRLMLDGREQYTSPWIARDIKESRHELGLHGYNHFSLWRKDWDNIQFMQSALQAVKKRWRIDYMGEFPRSYVPPTNNIDSLGLQALINTLTSVQYMCSIYLGDFSEGGNREFGPDPLAPKLFDYPRITSGYINDDISNFNQNSLSIYSGIWTHFVHPDDVFQVDKETIKNFRSRNPKKLGWHSSPDHGYGLYEVFVQRLKDTRQRYPLTRFLAVRDAAPITRRWLNTYSRYTVQKSALTVKTVPQQSQYQLNNEKYWFSYVRRQNSSIFEQALKSAGITYKQSPLWDGALYQFSTEKDSLAVPNFWAISGDDNEVLAKVRQQYADYMAVDASGDGEEWTDTRLDDALEAYSTNPEDQSLQDEVIGLALEFDKTPLAISILERRLMNNQVWRSKDIARLFKYYGWEQAEERAVAFTEKLWDKYSDLSILEFKEMLVDNFGVPSPEFEGKWLHREYRLNPNDPTLLKTLLQRAESWSERKRYLQKLIDLNPQSDSLYAYAIEQSTYYGTTDQTIDLLESFPDSVGVETQLMPLADEIAYRYAEEDKLTRAGMWAQKTDEVSYKTKLDWLLQQNRYHEFIERGEQYLAKGVGGDTLRNYIGRQLIYAEYREKGFETLYPLFVSGNAASQTRELVHSEIGYMGYEKQKSFYKRYPKFFPDSLRHSVRAQYRKQEGIKGGSQASFTSDNFDNNTGSVGIFSEWGNRKEYTHTISINNRYVSSNLLNNSKLDHLYNINYKYRHSFNDNSSQLVLGGGIYSDSKQTRPDLTAGYWVAGDSVFSSAKLDFKPVFTNPGLQQNINEIKAALYHERYLVSNRLQSTFSLTGSWYSDKNISYKGLGKLYVTLPFSTALTKVRPLISVGYADAKIGYPTGLPYYTPNNLFVKGLGVEFSNKNIRFDPTFSTRIELMGKHSNRDGMFLEASGQLTTELNKYWNISLNGYISTSKVYRYNSLNVSVTYTFPRNIQK